jgi:hypothetical protein
VEAGSGGQEWRLGEVGRRGRRQGRGWSPGGVTREEGTREAWAGEGEGAKGRGRWGLRGGGQEGTRGRGW